MHPFREGNTRAVITFAVQFANEKGVPLDKALLKEHATYVRDALVKASDGQYSEYHYLADIVADAMGAAPHKKPKELISKEYDYDK